MLKILFKLLKAITLILLVFLLLAVMVWLLLGYYLQVEDELHEVDAVVVISGGGLERIQKGVDLMQEGYAPYLILSGAAYDAGTSNAASMQQYALAKGIPSFQLLLEEQAQNTYQNANYVKQLLEQYQLRDIILVTSAYHQRRAYHTFRKILGDQAEILNAPAEPEYWQRSSWWKDQKAREISLEEFGKIVYSALSGNYGQ